jgi:signal transduction histidine kinase
MLDSIEPTRLAQLEEENRRLRVINKVLIERVEREMDPSASSAFSLFYNTVTVDSSVTQRTTTLTNLARRLMQEIAERREAEEALLDAKAVAEQANESKTNFLAAVSHDLRQPLHAARLFLAEMSQTAAPARALTLRTRIESALDAMDDMLESLLDMSRLDAGAWRIDPSAFALEPLLARLVAEFQPQAAAAGLRLRHVATRAVVETDRRLLERILRNLIANAVRYTDAGGIVVGVRGAGPQVRIDVVDTGIGIPREKWQLIFEEFHQLAAPLRTRGKGLGLGLAIVDRAARLLETPIDVQSQPGRGSRFSVSVRRAAAAAAPAVAPVAAVPDKLALARSAVLLVEDDPAVRQGMASLLRSWHCDVIEAESTAAALLGVARHGAAPDVMIADYHLLGADRGTGAVAAVRERCGRLVPALIVSSDCTPGLRVQAREADAMFLVKPVAPSKLRATLNFLLSKQG